MHSTTMSKLIRLNYEITELEKWLIDNSKAPTEDRVLVRFMIIGKILQKNDLKK